MLFVETCEAECNGRFERKVRVFCAFAGGGRDRGKVSLVRRMD